MAKKKKLKDPLIMDGDISIDTLLVEGSFFAPSGYSSATREFIHNYIKQYGNNYQKIFLIDRQWDNIRMILPERYKDTIEKYMVTENNKIQNVVPDKSMVLRWGIPPAFDHEGFDAVPHRIKAIYFVWECDRLPPLWVDLLWYYDVIFTSSKASARAIETSLKERGMNIPVEVIPHGISDEYKKEDKNTLDGFTFMMVGTFTERKAPMEMIEVFLRHFKDSDGVRLLWKVGGVAQPQQMLVLRREIQKLAFKLNIDMSDAPKIILDMNTYDHELLNELYNEADVLVQVSHGEAWGLPISNAMATGTPAITLVRGGHRSFCTNDTTFFVKDTGWIYSNGVNDWYAPTNGVKWLGIDMEDYGRVMRYVYENQEELNVKGEACLEKAEKFRWKNVVRMANKIFNKYDKLLLSRYERDQQGTS